MNPVNGVFKIITGVVFQKLVLTSVLVYKVTHVVKDHVLFKLKIVMVTGVLKTVIGVFLTRNS
eukprot:jgi/Orpsp1_1/1183547/evm.model.c7180000085687.1